MKYAGMPQGMWILFGKSFLTCVRRLLICPAASASNASGANDATNAGSRR